MLLLTKYFQTNFPPFGGNDKQAHLARSPFKIKIRGPDRFGCDSPGTRQPISLSPGPQLGGDSVCRESNGESTAGSALPVGACSTVGVRPARQGSEQALRRVDCALHGS